MSDSSFPLKVPPVPIPLISPDEGVPSVPDFRPYSYGSIGESTTGYDIPPSRPNQIGYDDAAATFSHEVIESGANPAKIKVRYGQVSNVDTSGTDPDISLATEYSVVDGSRIFIEVTVDTTNGQATAAQIYVNTTVPSDSAGTAYLQLAQVTVANGSITNIAQTASGSFDMLSCGAVHIFARVSN
jgi:hypothetical protein